MASRTDDEFSVALTIHGFTIGHAIVAGFLGPFAGAALTPMTIAMIIAIGAICGVHLTMSSIVNKAALLVGRFLGVAGAEILLGLIPGLGNLANAAASAGVTELLGWAIYSMFTEGLYVNDDIDVEALFREAADKRADNEALMRDIRATMDKMSFNDKSTYKNYMKIVRDRDASDTLKKEALDGAKGLLKKYGLTI